MGFAVLLLGCLCSVVPMSAQETARPVELEEAIALALQNHPRLRTATLELQRIRATRGEVVEAAPTEFSYAWGQLNGPEKRDKELAVTQSLGSLLTPFYKNALVNQQVAMGESYRQLVEKEVKAEVKRA